MGENSHIEWTDATFNPWIGCMKVSEGCKHCYAASMNERYRWVADWNGTYKRTSAQYWRQPRLWNERLEREGGKLLVFSGSLCDVLDPKVPQEWRDDLRKLIEETPHLTWMILSKYIQNHELLWSQEVGWPVHVAAGTTIEVQARYQRQIILSKINATRKFLSIEPMLEEVHIPLSGIDLVIVGGESGPAARVLDSLWVRRMYNDCLYWKVPFNFKQWGEWIPEDQLRYLPERDFDAYPKVIKNNMQFYRLGKKLTGKILDGNVYEERLK